MQYFSTNKKAGHVSFREAVLYGQPSDKGLYFPSVIPQLSWEDLRNKSKSQIAFDVIRPYVGETIPDEVLYGICNETVNFDFPLVKITEDIYTLELFHGPTYAFKDVGARFMSRCLSYFVRERKEKTVVIVATSGDTGGAVANGFFDVDGIDVVILYPSGKVSKLQELQMTTHGKNIHALEVEGTFDDCQKIAKTAMADEELNEKVFLTSANSINVARWLSQQFYYFYALQQWDDEANLPVISVPSGNFGNICAGILAQISGLPSKQFIAACNANDAIPQFLETGDLSPKPSVSTLSNAMDVGDPSNFVRILEMFDNDFPKLKGNLKAVSVSDKNTAETMWEVYDQTGYVLDPHGAVGFYALAEHLKNDGGKKGIVLETAHPVKFESVEQIIGAYGDTPDSVKDLFAKPQRSSKIEAKYTSFKGTLLEDIL